MGRLTESETLSAIADFQQYSIERCDFHAIQGLAFQLASSYQRSAL